MKIRISDLPLIGDVKADYIALRKEKVSRDQAVQQLFEDYFDSLADTDDRPQIHIGIADGQYQLKELSREAATLGLEALSALETLVPDIAVIDLTRRRENYAKAPMPERKSIPVRRKYRCDWSVGDTFACLLEGEDFDQLGLQGKYVLLQTVGFKETYDGRLVPVVVLYIWDSMPFPESTEQLYALLPLRLTTGGFRRPYGSYTYTTTIELTSRKTAASLPLIPIGNFPVPPLPEDAVPMVEDYYDAIPPNIFMMLLCRFCKVSKYYYTTTPESAPENWPFWMKEQKSDPTD